MRRFTRPARLLARIFCAVAFLSLGLAHKPPQVFAAVLQSAALQLPDGSFADLCIDDRSMPHPHERATTCEVCLISGQVVLPTPDGETWLLATFASLDNAPSETISAPMPQATSLPRSRGPPRLS